MVSYLMALAGRWAGASPALMAFDLAAFGRHSLVSDCPSLSRKSIISKLPSAATSDHTIWNSCNGKDIVAIKDMPGLGLVMSVWQAKKLERGNKVDLNVIRELADTRLEHKASKGLIVTTISLTKGTLARIERDCYLLHKVDGVDLLAWIREGKHP